MSVQRAVSPIDGSVVAERSTADAAAIDRLLRRAHDARREWSATAIGERAAVVERAVQWCLDHVDDLALEITLQMGRPITQSPAEIARGFQERARHMAAIAATELADIAAPATDGFVRYIRRDPVGTVLVVAPWNYPYLTAVNIVIPALLAGNTVVLKHSTQTLLCAERYEEAFRAAGLPRGVLQHVHATHDDIARMIANPRVDFVAFTGSVGGGHAIEQAASTRFIGTGLELGGKDPAYVRADCDLAFSVAELVDGSFFNSGQSCCGIERIYVHRDVYGEFVEQFTALTTDYVLGDPRDTTTTIGPMVNAAAADTVRGQIAEALDAGATACTSETDFAASEPGSPYLGPTVLVDVDHSMRVMREESFGPVIGIMAVDGDDEAVALMNDSDYGLTASIWTTDLDAAQAIGRRVETGTVYANRCDYVDPALAWTGVKDTGHGCTLSPLGFDAITRPKSFHLRAR
ncbi:MAG TPA: aldehyde dehydrogenase family protein [Acidimicrobiia bacterium]|jgi:acyl-CoA reductase-like NAD-dependent aldehyde dehydrogenase